MIKTVTILNRLTGESRDFEKGEGYEFTDYELQEGNYSCDCNRQLAFESFSDTDQSNYCIGCKQYIITHVDGSAVDFKDYNENYEP